MSQNSKKQVTSPETKEEATRVAKSTQRPGQNKEQTKLVADGIQKGIEQYKKQQKAKSRELDKRLKLAQKQSSAAPEGDVDTKIIYRQHWLPWGLLVLSWLASGLYLFGQ